MFICTDPDGIVYVPAFYSSASPYQDDSSYRCKMKRSYTDCERVLQEYRELMPLIKSVQAKEDRRRGAWCMGGSEQISRERSKANALCFFRDVPQTVSPICIINL
ncbi:MAG: hypothetical protein IJJ99_09730 [Oscillospiraceae bacterium]|nr:hypothetical protein [Oscillospiraceae bacterium]